MGRVQHILKTGLKHGKYYKLYVTQVNTAGIESNKSEPALVRVGDVDAPPVPTLTVVSQVKNRGFVDVKVSWTPSVSDDLSHCVIYTWKQWGDWDADGVHSKTNATSASTNIVVTNAQTSYTVAQQENHKHLWIGIQAVDLSNNTSDIYIVKTLVEDSSNTIAPVDAPTVTPGVWKITVTVDCPVSYSIEKIIVYRDNSNVAIDMTNSTGVMFFQSGLLASYVDNLRVIDGLTHYYTYAWVDFNGNISPRSPASLTVTAVSIDTTMIDQMTFKALNNAWTSDFISKGGVPDIEKLKSDLLTQVTTTTNLAGQLANVQDNYDGLYDKYNLLINQLSIISAKVDTQDDTISNLETEIDQNAEQIELRAKQIDVDSKTSQITTAYTSLFQQNAQSIATVVSNLNKNALTYTSIAQLSDQIQLKVSANGIISAINMSPETIQLNGNRIHITGDTLFDRDVRIMQNLYVGGSYNAENGWSDMFNGLRMQWGRFNMPGGNNIIYGRCNFPVAFSNCLAVVITGNGKAQNNWYGYSVVASSWDGAGFVWLADTLGTQVSPFQGSIPVSYIAIGTK